jgi:hypothetical protein
MTSKSKTDADHPPVLTFNACGAEASRKRTIREVSNLLPEEIDLLFYHEARWSSVTGKNSLLQG